MHVVVVRGSERTALAGAMMRIGAFFILDRESVPTDAGSAPTAAQRTAAPQHAQQRLSFYSSFPFRNTTTTTTIPTDDTDR